MARTAVTINTVTQNTALSNPTETAIDATNSHVLSPGSTPLEEIFLRIVNTTASTKTVTVKAGVNPPALAAGQGDLVVSLTAGNVTPQVAIVQLESGRFLQSDGTVNVDIAASTTGTITAFRVAR